MANSKQKQAFWIAINSKETARQVSRQAVWAAGLVAVITAAFAAFSISQQGTLPDNFPKADAWAFWDAGFFAAIAWGIYKMSRVAAVAGLVLYVAEQILMRMDNPKASGSGIFLAVVIVLAFINGVRGTFAYHRFHRTSTGADTDSEA